MITIFGATGNTGGAAAAVLAKKDRALRLVSRHHQRPSDFSGTKVERFVADLQDTEQLRAVLEGATAAYVLIPPNVSVPDFRAYQKRVTRSVVDALASSKCRKVAILSSMGAEHAAGTGPIVGLHELEQGLRGLAIDVLAIRAGFFMENMLTNIGLIRGQGVLGAPAPAEAPMTLIASHDIGRYAGERLAALDWNGFEVVNLMGPALVTFGQATQIIGQAIGKPDLPYVKFSFDDTKQGMVQAGLPEQLADLYIEMYQGAGKNLLAPQAGTPIVHTETTFESFAQQVFAPAYRAAGAA